MADFGFDVADHTAVNPVFGTLVDFDASGDRGARRRSARHSDRHAWSSRRARRATTPGVTGTCGAVPASDGGPQQRRTTRVTGTRCTVCCAPLWRSTTTHHPCWPARSAGSRRARRLLRRRRRAAPAAEPPHDCRPAVDTRRRPRAGRAGRYEQVVVTDDLYGYIPNGRCRAHPGRAVVHRQTHPHCDRRPAKVLRSTAADRTRRINGDLTLARTRPSCSPRHRALSRPPGVEDDHIGCAGSPHTPVRATVRSLHTT